MPSHFEDLMSQKTDDQLLKIVAGRPGDYQPEALAAAQREATKRNLSHDRFEEAKTEAVNQDSRSAEIASIPLETLYKALSFFFPGVVLFMFASALRAKGYERKADELVRWTFYGIAFYIAIGIFISLF